MTTIYSRSSWGARHDNGDLTLSGLADEVFVHHTATANVPADATVARERQVMRELEAIGESRFSQGISYNVLVFASGRAYQGVSFNRRGTHTGGRNSTTRSICFVGNFENAKPTEAALRTAANIYAEGQGKWWKRGAPVRGHRDVKATACPGRYLYPHLGRIRSGGSSTTPAKPPATSKTVTTKRDGFTMQKLNLKNAHKRRVRGGEVRKLQGLLLAHGYGPEGLVGGNGRPDGSAGPATRDAVARFQIKHNVGDGDGHADYVVGAGTWSKLVEG